MKNTTSHHYFASTYATFARGDSPEEAREKALKHCKKVARRKPLFIYVCKVPLARDAAYKTVNWVPEVDGVEHIEYTEFPQGAA